MAELIKILVVDDDRVWRNYLTETLKSFCDVTTASDGDEALALTYANSPHVLLLDLEMPQKSGYEVCQTLKLNPDTRDIPIIFLSHKSSLREKIVSFQLGADDYLVKPGEPELLRARVRRAAEVYSEKRELNRRTNEAQVAVFDALSSSADLGRSLRFAERTYTMTSYDKLAEGLFQTMGEFGLDTSVMFLTHQGPLFYAQNKHELSPLEQDMFKAIHQEGRFVDFGARTFCNFKLVSLLIKNMPIEEPERYGRLKDTVPWILGATDGKVGALDSQARIKIEYDRMALSIKALEQQLASVATGIHSRKVQADLAASIQFAQKELASLRQHHQALAEIIAVDKEGESGNELASNEIFSSDVDFF